MARTLMFTDSRGKRVLTWNPVIGCRHDCSYCWARFTAERIYGSFEPKFIPSRLDKVPKSGVVFPVSMGDLFGWWVPSEWIEAVLKATHKAPRATFMFFTKNPARYAEFLGLFPENAWLGTTVETNIDCLVQSLGISKAPPPSERLSAMVRLDWSNKVVSVEPIMAFTANFPRRLLATGAKLFYVGYANHNAPVPEPPLRATEWLIQTLVNAGVEVRRKTLRPGRWEDVSDVLRDLRRKGRRCNA